MSLVELSNLAFSYDNNSSVLKDINLSIPRGSVYGFLGANGQGKSTTLKLLLGLLKPKSGTIKIFGEKVPNAFPKALYNIGSLVESPSLYEHLNARQNLFIWSRLYRTSKSRIEEVLELVKLSNVQEKKVAKYSTGMRQRLGLAIALLHNPELLILDEPTNGLDPEGTIELRQIIKNLQEDGKTIIISSHILSEVEKMVDKIGIIKDGKTVFEGTIGELKRLENSELKIMVRVDDSEKAASILQSKKVLILQEGKIQVLCKSDEEVSEIIKKLVVAEVKIYGVTDQSNNLENLFLNVTRN